jgi:hypothetical protein
VARLSAGGGATRSPPPPGLRSSSSVALWGPEARDCTLAVSSPALSRNARNFDHLV